MATSKEIIQPEGQTKAGCLTIIVCRRRRVVELGTKWSLSITVRSKSWSETTYGGTDFEFFAGTSNSPTVWGDDQLRAELRSEFEELADVFKNMPTIGELESAVESAFDAMLTMQSVGNPTN